MLLTAAALCNDNSHSMVQKKEEAKISTRNTSNASTYEMGYMLHQKAFFLQSACHLTIKRGCHSAALLVLCTRRKRLESIDHT